MNSNAEEAAREIWRDEGDVFELSTADGVPMLAAIISKHCVKLTDIEISDLAIELQERFDIRDGDTPVRLNTIKDCILQTCRKWESAGKS